MWEKHGEMVEGAAGMTIAAVKNMKETVRDKVVCAVMCGGNIDKDTHRVAIMGL